MTCAMLRNRLSLCAGSGFLFHGIKLKLGGFKNRIELHTSVAPKFFDMNKMIKVIITIILNLFILFLFRFDKGKGQILIIFHFDCSVSHENYQF